MKKTNDSDRLNLILSELKISKNALSKALGYTNNVGLTNISKGMYGFSSEMASRLVKLHPAFNYDWILEGKGEMLNEKSVEKISIQQQSSQLEINFDALVQVSQQNAETNLQNAKSLDRIISLYEKEKEEKAALIKLLQGTQSNDTVAAERDNYKAMYESLAGVTTAKRVIRSVDTKVIPDTKPHRADRRTKH